jgi:two-component system repressor protein LuxO
VRIVAATHRNLAQRVAAGMFRDDLYFRLSVLAIHMPPLRERREDIPQLAEACLLSASRAEGRACPRIDPATMEALCRRDWPGNIRELQNTLHQALVMNDGDMLTAEMLPPPLTPPPAIRLATRRVKPLHIVQREAIDEAILHCAGNIPRAAALLEVSPSTLYRRREAPDEASNN